MGSVDVGKRVWKREERERRKRKERKRRGSLGVS